MKILFEKIEKRINGLIWSFASTGFLLIFMAILTIFSDVFVRITFGLMAIIIAYIFIYSASKLWSLKKDIKNHFKF